MSGELLFHTLATLHNLTHYLDIMRRMRESILLGTFPELLRATRAFASSAEPEIE
jgi:queuine/archaeosine tRNA-ribosyltransferase